MDVGLRVVRGPDWKWGNQDEGEGHVGTVVEIGRPGSQSTPDKTVVVQWDSGSRTNYRVGYQGACDLRIYDNAPIGVRHPNIICNSCKKHGICGMRWKCLNCSNYDLCTNCYMADKHDLNHIFARFETSSSVGVEMPKRSAKNITKIQARGIFNSARVVRGCDWDWGNQDGGEGKVGKVIDIRGWNNESRRSVANVMWASGSTNVYRLGHKGKVDLKYVIDAAGGYYYRDHLPILGQTTINEQSPKRSETASTSAVTSGASLSQSPAGCIFNVGDKVKVIINDENDLKLMQEGHGGWNPRMAQFIGQVGTVHRVTERGDIRVQFEGCHNRWTFNPDALTKVTSYSVGDIVRIIDDGNCVRDLQRSHGEWIDLMKGALGKMGKVVKVYTDGDIRVTVDGQTWTFNPLCVTLLPGSMLEMNNTMVNHQQQREDVNPRIGHLLETQPHSNRSSDVIGDGMQLTLSSEAGTSAASGSNCITNQTVLTEESIVRESAQGKIDSVREILRQNPKAINHRSSGKTALQVACHQGHMEIAELLLSMKPNIDAKDDDGDTALHYAAFGDQPEMLELLLQAGATIDAINKTKCSSLHIAVNKGHLNCVNVLLKYGCNVNLQDTYGDTALHDAIGKTFPNPSSPEPGTSQQPQQVTSATSTTPTASDVINNDIMELLINAPRSDFTIRNKRGFNCLHQAALKGNSFAAEKLILKSRQLVDIKKEDGFAALHLAALNGHYTVAETLIINGQAHVDIANNRKQTPLHLAVSQLHAPIIELLVSMDANCNAVDEESDTPLHIALSKWAEQVNIVDSTILENSPVISNLLSQLSEIGHGKSMNLAIASYLIQDGKANVNMRNRSGKTPFDYIECNTRSGGLNSSGSIPGTSSSSSGNIINSNGNTNNSLCDLTSVNSVKAFLHGLLEAREEQQRQALVEGETNSSLPLYPSSNEQLLLHQCTDQPNDYGIGQLRIGDIIPGDVIEIECLICNEIFANVQFSPCYHQICCVDCCSKMKKCIICQQQIEKKIIFNRETGQISEILDTSLMTNIKCNEIKSPHTSINKQTSGILGGRMDISSSPVNFTGASSAVDRLRLLESKVAEYEEASSCGICMERIKNVVFLCGHGACVNCAQTLKTCHMCRKTITKKINCY